MTDRPDIYPDHAMIDATFVGAPPSTVRTQGYPPGSKGIARWQNSQMKGTATWLRYLDETRLSPADLFTANALISANALSFPLNTTLSPSPNGGATYILNGVRVEYPTALLATTWPEGTLVWAANATNYVHARARPLEIAARSIGDLVVNTNPVPPAGYVTILSGVTTGTGISALTPLVTKALVFPFALSGITNLTMTGNLVVGGTGNVTETLHVDGDITSSSSIRSGLYLYAPDNASIGPAIDEDYKLLVGVGNVASLRVLGSDAVPAGSFAGRVVIDPADAGPPGAPSLLVNSYEAAPNGRPAAEFYGEDSSSGAPWAVYILGDDGYPALTVETAGNSPAIDAYGGLFAGGAAVRGTARHNQGYGGEFSADPFGSNDGAGVRARGENGSPGMWASGESGAAVRLTLGTGPHLKFDTTAGIPVAAGFEGEVWYQTTRGLGAAVPADDPIYWVASQGGGVAGGGGTHNISQSSTGSAWLIAHQETLSGVHAPKVAGKQIAIIGTWELGSLNTSCNAEIRIRDLTSNVVIQTWNVRLNIGGGNFEANVTRVVRYTVPAAGNRTFVVEFRRSQVDLINVKGQNGAIFVSPALF